MRAFLAKARRPPHREAFAREPIEAALAAAHRDLLGAHFRLFGQRQGEHALAQLCLDLLRIDALGQGEGATEASVTALEGVEPIS